MEVLEPLSSSSRVLASAPSWTPTITTSGELLGLEGGALGGLALDVPGKATPSRLEGPHGKGVDTLETAVTLSPNRNSEEGGRFFNLDLWSKSIRFRYSDLRVRSLYFQYNTS